jgi:hypothetical protein
VTKSLQYALRHAKYFFLVCRSRYPSIIFVLSRGLWNESDSFRRSQCDYTHSYYGRRHGNRDNLFVKDIAQDLIDQLGKSNPSRSGNLLAPPEKTSHGWFKYLEARLRSVDFAEIEAPNVS